MVAGMNRRRWMQWGAVGAVAAVALTGCVGEDEPDPSTISSTESASPTELELATATAILERFAELSSLALRTGEVSNELEELVSPTLLASVEGDLAAFEASDYVLVGELIVDSVLVASDPGADPVVVAACMDGSESEVVDGAGVEVPSGGVQRQPIVAEVSDIGGEAVLELLVYDTLDGVGDPC